MRIELFGPVFTDFLVPLFFIFFTIYWGGQLIWWTSYWVRDAFWSLDEDKQVWPAGRLITKDLGVYMFGGYWGTLLGFGCIVFWFIMLPVVIITIALLLLRRAIRRVKHGKGTNDSSRSRHSSTHN